MAAIRTANDPNTNEKTRKTAKKFLRNSLSRDAIMGFIEGQMASGDKNLALDLATAVSWTDEKSGNRFLEFFKGKKAERLYLGKDRPSLEQALDNYAKSNGGLHVATLAKEEHQDLAPTEYVASENALIEGRPSGASAPNVKGTAEGRKARNRGSVRVAQKSARYQPIRIRSSQRNKVRKSGGGGAQSGGGGGEGSSIYNATCTAACHVSWPKERAAMLDAVRSNRMPPEDSGKKLSADERSALIAYLSK